MCANNYWQNYCKNVMLIDKLRRENVDLIRKLEASVAETAGFAAGINVARNWLQ